MVRKTHAQVKEDVMRVLQDLTEPQRRLFTEVLRIESENLHLERPRVKDDIVQAVRRIFK